MTRRLGVIAAGVWLLAAPAWAATFTVDSTGDDPDASPGDGTCATAGGACTLRAAIDEANAHPDADTIAFDIAGSGSTRSCRPEASRPSRRRSRSTASRSRARSRTRARPGRSTPCR